ncbi:hypothetical protein CLF_109218 [Clonorchis sinensis]|uniref:Uncharacterized protein n=1 Tax=Clonorchis sinensis TaxID=79923 RepID=G7YJ24_CLOSI|nr:hypothetical protein CLF_109218 [Clonorchis sinensis]
MTVLVNHARTTDNRNLGACTEVYWISLRKTFGIPTTKCDGVPVRSCVHTLVHHEFVTYTLRNASPEFRSHLDVDKLSRPACFSLGLPQLRREFLKERQSCREIYSTLRHKTGEMQILTVSGAFSVNRPAECTIISTSVTCMYVVYQQCTGTPDTLSGLFSFDLSLKRKHELAKISL